MADHGQTISGCGICGGFRVSIRGRIPKEASRVVCPTCLADCMDQIHQTSSPDYGKAFATAPEPSAEEEN